MDPANPQVTSTTAPNAARADVNFKVLDLSGTLRGQDGLRRGEMVILSAKTGPKSQYEPVVKRKE